MTRYLITGSSGQIGRALVPELLGHGHVVKELDHSHGDLTHQRVAEKLIGSQRVDVVIHLAAQVGRLWCDDDPVHAWRSNVIMTRNVAEQTKKIGARMVYCSTSEVYGDHGDIQLDEETIPAPSSGSYAETKFVGELVSRAMCPEGLQIWRPVMAYGPGVPPGRGRAAILNVLQSAINNQPIVVHRGGARSWMYIDDVARGMLIALERGRDGIYNIGRDDDLISMQLLAALACEVTGSLSFICTETAPPSQTLVKNLSCAKLAALGFRPEVALSEGMSIVAEYLRHR